MAKTKIELFEDMLILEGLTEEKLQEYEKLLKRAGDDWCRIQHCFITAYEFPVKRLDDAIMLIEFGNKRYASNESYLLNSNLRLGWIYSRAGLYQKAYDTFLSLSLNPNVYKYAGDLPWYLLDAKMHADQFNYSLELEEYIELCQRDNIITKSFLQNKFILAVAEYIVADFYKDYDKKQRSYDAICEMFEPGYRGPLYNHLKKHKYDEQLKITTECNKFLENINLVNR